MPTTIDHQSDNIYLLRLSGEVKQSEFQDVQNVVARAIEGGAKPRLLAILENFDGWQKGVDWSDLDFLFKHANEIAKIAIVGDARWEAQGLAFAGAGFRRAPVRFFLPGQLIEARKWVSE
jgi:hypothetical protein